MNMELNVLIKSMKLQTKNVLIFRRNDTWKIKLMSLVFVQQHFVIKSNRVTLQFQKQIN